MPLAPGVLLGPYEIVAPLGAGGMGEVYRARDTRLKRDVALKVLPDTFAQDADRLARFQREAQLLATLNHPNIAQIYGVEQAGDGLCIVMELVEGETLADRLSVGPFDVDEALHTARQVADALESAHDRGIIHRDLKPGNIKVTPEGKVKVLDFGLAKATDQAAAPSSPGGGQITASPTLSLQATRAGVILGTAAYMSPEQARGKPVDRRTDIWAFGCVLYEMLAGRQTFDAGETVSDAIAAILTRDPDWRALPASTPAHIRTLLRRCLQRDLQKRLPHIGLARLEFDEGSSEPAPAVPTSAPPLWKRIVPFASVAAVGALASFGLTMWMLRPRPAPAVVTRFVYNLLENQRLTDTFLTSVAVSPDGTQIVYVANRQLYLKSMSDLIARPIPGTQVEQGGNIGSPIFSPDGQSIVYWTRAAALSTDRGSLRKLRFNGGAPVTLAEIGFPLGMSWQAGGILVGQSNQSGMGGIIRIPENGGAAEQIVHANDDEVLQGPQMLPGNNAVLFAASAAGGLAFAPLPIPNEQAWDTAQIVALSLPSRERTVLIKGGSDARYVRTGHLVYASGGVLFARPFDVRRRAFTGEAIPVIEGVSRNRAGRLANGSAQWSVSDTGTFVYVPGPASSPTEQRDLVIVDRNGTFERVKVPPGAYVGPRASPDGKQITFGTDDAREAIVWVYDLSGSTSVRRLTLEGKNRLAVWSHDGQRIAFQSERDGQLGIFWQRADGGTPAEPLIMPERGVTVIPDSWTPDGKYLFFTKSDSRGSSLWTYSTESKKASPFGNVQSGPSVALMSASVSPDGRWVAYVTSAQATRASLQLFVQPIPATGARYLIATGSTDALWSPTGRELFFFSLVSGEAFSTEITTEPRFAVGNPRPLPPDVLDAFRRSRPGPGSPGSIATMPDGRFVAAVGNRDGIDSNVTQLQIVVNWFEELKQRVPTK